MLVRGSTRGNSSKNVVCNTNFVHLNQIFKTFDLMLARSLNFKKYKDCGVKNVHVLMNE